VLRLVTNTHTEIQSTIANYVRGYLEADGDRLSQAFHPETRLHSASEKGELERTEMAGWLENLRTRKEKGDIREGRFEVAFIDVSGDSAVAKVLLQLPKLQFTDYLSLLRIQGRWLITGKIYTAS
jgi:hypothetical protein